MTVEYKHILSHRGTFVGHNGWITKISVPINRDDMLVSASRDKKLFVWKLTEQDGAVDGYAMRSLVGHNHFVTDCALSNDSRHAISSSWDQTLRMWDLETNTCRTRFNGHADDVLSVVFSTDNRQIFSSSRDATIKLWNIVGQAKYNFDKSKGSHGSCVNTLSLCRDPSNPLMASGGADKTVRVWRCSDGKLEAIYHGHTSAVHSVHFDVTGNTLASGGKDGIVNVWDHKKSAIIGSCQLPSDVSCVKFCPTKPLLAVASGSGILIFDTENVEEKLMSLYINPEELEKEVFLPSYVKCTTLSWSDDGKTIFAGYSDHKIRVFKLEKRGQ